MIRLLSGALSFLSFRAWTYIFCANLDQGK
uniref:Uncharacterized protein n=1 Tax=Arundo donax TaxID=35708 RepID=A0A0A8ZDV3_ARUDO